MSSAKRAKIESPFGVGDRVQIRLHKSDTEHAWYVGTVVHVWQLTKKQTSDKYTAAVKVQFDSDIAPRTFAVPNECVQSAQGEQESPMPPLLPTLPSEQKGDESSDGEETASEEDVLSASELKFGYSSFAGGKKERALLIKADKQAESVLQTCRQNGRLVTADDVQAVLDILGDSWPTQTRPNVSVTGKAVPGMCLGVVHVLGGVGMSASAIARAFPHLTRLIVQWVKASLPAPDFPFCSIQINYNYRAKKHTDTNNIGPSYIISVGEHTGGELWVADQFVVDNKEEEKPDGPAEEANNSCCSGSGGGGEGILDCHNKWCLFNGNAEHETMPFSPVDGKCKRVSFIVFTHHAYNKLNSQTAAYLQNLGFTCGSTDGIDLPYFDRYRVDKLVFGQEEIQIFEKKKEERRASMPPPSGRGVVAVENFGYSMGKGGGFFSFVEDADNSSSNTPTVIELTKNTTGFHVLQLQLRQSDQFGQDISQQQQLQQTSLHTQGQRFDFYKQPTKEPARFCQWVESLQEGAVVVIGITDTAVKSSAPLQPSFYDSLRALGAPQHIEPIGYRLPFGFIGVKGAAAGEAILVMQKTKVVLRVQAEVKREGGKVVLVNKRFDSWNVTNDILEQKRAKAKKK